MTDNKAATPLSLGAEFAGADRDAWLALVEKSLRGVPFEKALVRRTYEGIERRPLYTAADWTGEEATPRVTAEGDRVNVGWDIRQAHSNPDLAATNRAILSDLERGVTSILLDLGDAVRSVEDLERVLRGVHLDMAPIALRPGADFMAQAAQLMALWHRRGLAGDAVAGNLGVDPLGTLSRGEALPDGVDATLARAAELAGHVAGTHPGVRTLLVDASPYYEAGANEVQDLACALATGVAYLRALTSAGLSLEQAAGQIQFTLALGVDAFPAIAKLRAARRLWHRVIEASGGDPVACPMQLHVCTAGRVMATRDAWVNMLRTTVAAFAGAVGGADSLTVLPYSHAAGQPEEFARRIARNTQLILMEESSLGRVTDPAGGSWYAETLTDQIAQAAWAEFQEIERAGGMAATLRSGAIHDKLAAAWAERERNLARRRDAVTGVSTFPNLEETAVDVVAAVTTPTDNDNEASSVSPEGRDIATLIAAAEAGATIADLRAVEIGTPTSIDALGRHRLGEAFEALRDASDAHLARTGARPRVLLANLGTPADYTGRTTFSKSYVEAGGLEAVQVEIDATNAAGAFIESGAGLAVICSSDKIYAEQAVAVAQALTDAGAKSVVLAGKPGDLEEALRAGGVDRFIFAGDDALANLRELAACLGVNGA